MRRYFVSFYNPKTDCYLETAAHYSNQTALWQKNAELHIDKANELYEKFSTSGILPDMLRFE